MKGKNEIISDVSKSILLTLAYYDIFEYPLTREEIFMHANSNGHTKENVFDEIESLRFNDLLEESEGYYSLTKNSKIISRRIDGNKRASKKMKIAKIISQLISNFPYVRGVFLSGSIAKGFMDERADIDYFIITKPKRLWVARFLLVLFKKIFLFNSHKYFCINYFIDSENLEIEEKNIYTATELVTLIPIYGSNLYEEFCNKNTWVKDLIPNFPKRDTSLVKKSKRKLLQFIPETLLNGKLGDKLDDRLINLFERYDHRRYNSLKEDDYQIAFKTRKNVSKHHPNNFQKKILTELSEKIRMIENQHNILIS